MPADQQQVELSPRLRANNTAFKWMKRTIAIPIIIWYILEISYSSVDAREVLRFTGSPSAWTAGYQIPLLVLSFFSVFSGVAQFIEPSKRWVADGEYWPGATTFFFAPINFVAFIIAASFCAVAEAHATCREITNGQGESECVVDGKIAPFGFMIAFTWLALLGYGSVLGFLNRRAEKRQPDAETGLSGSTTVHLDTFPTPDRTNTEGNKWETVRL